MSGGLPDKVVPYLIRSKNGDRNKTDTSEWARKLEEKRKGYLPADWKNYYSQCTGIEIRNGDFLALWQSSSTNPTITEDSGSRKPLPLGPPYILCLHGGGYSGLTWAPLINELSGLIEADYGALDLRAHGESDCKDEDDLSLQTMIDDVIDVVQWLKEGPVKLGTRPLILIGHSMGGALCVNVALKLQDRNDLNLCGLVVLDVVEGSAMQALSSMMYFLRTRPEQFATLSEAIQWSVKSAQTRNLDSARISMLGQLKTCSGRLATQLVDSEGLKCNNNESPSSRLWKNESAVKEDSADSSGSQPASIPMLPPTEALVWRINLANSQPHWRGWFQGLSSKFLSVGCPKLLMLAGVDRLDKELTVGQMQGKFQMQVFHQVGHTVHEDAPEKAAECVASFLNRQRLVKTKVQLKPALPGC